MKRTALQDKRVGVLRRKTTTWLIGPEKFSGLSRNGPMGRIGNETWRATYYHNTKFLEMLGNYQKKRRKLRQIRCPPKFLLQNSLIW